MRRAAAELRYRREVLGGAAPLGDLTRNEVRVFSQSGEDGILRAIFARLGPGGRYYVEFGVEDGRECNTRYLREAHGWTGLLMDGGHDDPATNLRRESVTAENVGDLFAKYGVPSEPDPLSIDVDGDDHHVWRALAPRWRPRVGVAEYNAMCGPTERRSIAYEPAVRWSGTDYMGASLGALVAVAREFGYTLVACDSAGVNAFFVRDDLVGALVRPRAPEARYRPPAFADGRGHPPDPSRRMRPV